MSNYETEEQELEALKKWWKENSTSLLLGLSLGVIGLGGWNYYSTTQDAHRVEASDMYITMLRGIETKANDSIISASLDKLVESYSDTPYAAMASLASASYAHDQGEVDKAIGHLRWVNAHATDTEILHTARLRLARLLISQEKHDEAKSLLMGDYPVAFTALYEELKGDLFAAMGELQQARVAYDKAISQASGGSSLLQIKRRELGESKLQSGEADSAA